MIVTQNQNELENAMRQAKVWAFVPTMGALHAGHISLIKAAQKAYDKVICSIFVNPTQFNDPKDFEKYPNTLEKDLELLKKANCDLVYTPKVSEIYPQDSQKHLKKYDLGPLETVMEGQMRPGHYQGVANVVRILLEKVKPQALFLGEKDFQQIQVIRKMMQIENIPIPIHMGPTIRDERGLALSSRNARLSPEGLQKASILFEVLTFIKNQGQNQAPALTLEKAKEILNKVPEIQLEYLEIHPQDNLTKKVEVWQKDNVYRAFIAAGLENIRLIDTLEL